MLTPMDTGGYLHRSLQAPDFYTFMTLVYFRIIIFDQLVVIYDVLGVSIILAHLPFSLDL